MNTNMQQLENDLYTTRFVLAELIEFLGSRADWHGTLTQFVETCPAAAALLADAAEKRKSFVGEG